MPDNLPRAAMTTTSVSEHLSLHLPQFTYSDLCLPHKLAELTDVFYSAVRAQNPALFERFDAYRQVKGAGFDVTESSAILVEMAPYLDAFVAKMFGVEAEMKSKKIFAERERILFKFRKEFFNRKALKKYTAEQALQFDRQKLDAQAEALKKGFNGIPDADAELHMAALVMELWGIERSAKEPLSAEHKTAVLTLRDRLRGEPALAGILPASDDEEALKQVRQGIADIEAGRVIPWEEAQKRLGL